MYLERLIKRLMSKSKKSSHLESVDSNPTTGLQLEGDIKSAITKDKEHIYMVGNEEVPYEEGFRMSVGHLLHDFPDRFNAATPHVELTRPRMETPHDHPHLERTVACTLSLHVKSNML